VTIELVRRWLLKRHPMQSARWELEQLDDQANHLYKQATEVRHAGEGERAIELYDRVLKANPNHFAALFELAEAYSEVEDYSQSVELYTRAYRIEPLRVKESFVQVLLSYSRDLILQGKFEQAKASLTRALSLEPGNVRAHRRLEEAEAGIRRATAVRNPFIAGRPVAPHEFVGREQQTQILFSHIVGRSHIAVHGERGMGKTSLLRNVTSPEVWRKHGADPSAALIAYVDCQLIGVFSPSAFWRQVLIELQQQQQAKGNAALIEMAGQLASAETVSAREIRELLQAINTHERLLVVLLDEFDVTFQPHEAYSESEMSAFLAQLRALASHPSAAGSLSFVVATRRRPHELERPTTASPLSNILRPLPLKPFDDHETAALLAKMPDVFALSNREQGWIRQVAGGYPYLLQAALSILFRLHAEDKVFDVGQATQEFATIVEPLFGRLWHNASDEERIILTLIALQNFAAHTGKRLDELHDVVGLLNQYQRDLSTLEERGLLAWRDHEGPRRYALISSVLEWWIIKEIETCREDELQERVKTLTGLGQQPSVPLSEVLRHIWQNKVAVQNIGAWGTPPAGRR
jgi:tetratricopeptide (TPR) repeat protein